jgi:hypothetical protein
MTMIQLIARYESGAIADHEMVVRCLNMLDPGDPRAVLGSLRPDLLPRLREFLEAYRPGEMIASNGGAIPTLAQVLAAKSWLDSIEKKGHRTSAQYKISKIEAR